MNSLDISVAVLISISIMIGIWRGFIREALSLATWVVAGFMAWVFAGPVAVIFEKDVTQPQIQMIAAFALIFVVVYVLGSIVTFIFHKILTKKPFFKLTNQVLGAALGATRGLIIVVFAFMLAGMSVSIPKSDWWQSSRFAPFFQTLSLGMADILPQDIARHIHYD
jgi:membrane protein required for colicin V production